MSTQRLQLVIVGAYLWVMVILLGSIALETFMVYPNIFHDPPASLTTALAFMAVRAPSDFYPPLGFLSWALGTASIAAVWREPAARRWTALSLVMIMSEGLVSMAWFWPRNTILFVEGLAVHAPDVLRQVAFEFERLHWLRVAFNAVASGAAFAGFLACYRRWVVASADIHSVARAEAAVDDVSSRHEAPQLRPRVHPVGRLVLTAVSVAIVVGTAVADLSALHAQNPALPSHARFHAIWHVLHVAAVQGVALAVLWVAARGTVGLRVSLAAAIMAAYVVSFLSAALAAPFFGASLAPDVPPEAMPPRPLGLDGNLVSVLIATPIIAAGWWLARSAAATRREHRQEPL